MSESSSQQVVLFGAIGAFSLGGAWFGGVSGLAAVSLGIVLASWLHRESRGEDASETIVVLPTPIKEPPLEEQSSSGLKPLPLEPTEARDLDDLGLVWRLALDACSDGQLIVGPADTVLYANPAVGRILRFAPLDLLGVPVDELFPTLADEETSTAGYRRTGSDILGVEWRTTGVRGDRSTFPAEITINPLDESGMGVYQVRDITDRVGAEERTHKVNVVLEGLRNRALDASHAKSAFLANMSHELRTPLNAILGYSEMLTEELTDEGSLGDVRKIRSAGRHLMSLINTILDLSKIEAGRMELFMEALSVSLLIQELNVLVEPLVDDNNNTFSIEIEEDVGRIVADQVKLRQVLLNVLGNAFKFTEHGHIVLKVRRTTANDADWLHFEVTDTGIGIPRDQLDRVFKEFDQGDMSTARQFGGSGLGLSISRRFCRMMGGDITVQSDLGKGSTFLVRLPANTDKGTEELDLSGDSHVRVLVIDDDPGVRELMARTLAGSGYQVLTASTGDQGLAMAKTYQPHVITLDVMMPGMDGWDVLARLKEEPDLRSIPVLMVSMVDEARKGYALGATAYLMKPIDRSHLIELVSAFQGDDPLDVLIVDDDDDVREIIRRILASSGQITIREATDGVEALLAMEERIPGLLLLDLMMPGMDGFSLLNAMEKRPELSQVEVVVLSALDLTAEQHLLLDSRVQFILEKGSCSQEELLRLVRAKVTAHALERTGGS